MSTSRLARHLGLFAWFVATCWMTLAPVRAAERPTGTPFAWGDNLFTFPESFTNLVAIDSSNQYFLGLRADGTVVQAGGGLFAPIPPDLTNVTAISAGYYFQMALRSNGQVVMWGAPGLVGAHTLLSPPDWLTNVVAISAGMNHALALTSDGYVIAWGTDNGFGIAAPLDLTFPKSIVAGQQVGFAIRSDGKAEGWGANLYGIQAPPAAFKTPTQIDLGPFMSAVGLDAEGKVYAWGENSGNQLTVPRNVSNVVQVAAGSLHNVALRADGSVVTWGGNGESYVKLPAHMPKLFAVAAGQRFSVGLTRGPVPNTVPQFARQAAGTDFVLSTPFLSATPYRVSWFRDGVYLTNTPTSELPLTNLQLPDGGNYTAVASNEFSVVESPAYQLAIEPSAPTILSQPVSTAAVPGAQVAFHVRVRGSEPFLYQWRRNGLNLEGQTNSNLILTNLSASMEGTYSIAISNTVGSVVSDTVVLSTGKPFPLTHPISLVLLPGMPLNLSAHFVAPEVPSLQWWFGTNALDGELNESLHLPSVSAQNLGTYSLVASNSFGMSTSRIAQVHVRSFPSPHPEPGVVFSWNPNQQVPLEVPSDLTNAVSVAVSLYHAMALLADGTVRTWAVENLPWANEFIPPAGLSNVVEIAAGLNHCLALKRDGTVIGWGHRSDDLGQSIIPQGLSNVVEIAAGREQSMALRADGSVVAWSISQIPTNLTSIVALSTFSRAWLAQRSDGSLLSFYDGSSVVSKVYPAASARQFTVGIPVGAIIRHDGSLAVLTQDGIQEVQTPVANSPIAEIIPTSDLFLLRYEDGHIGYLRPGSPVPPPDPTNQRHITRIAGSDLHNLAITRAPFVQNQSSDTLANHGSSVTLSAGVRSPGPLTSQWYRNGTQLPAQTSPTLALPRVGYDDEGIYHAEFSSGGITTTSAPIRLTVVGPPEVRIAGNTTAIAGTDLTLEPTVLGPRPIAYQWWFGNDPIPGKTGQRLLLSNLQAAETGLYFLTASNSYGITRSAPVILTVVPSAPVVQESPSSQTLLEGLPLRLVSRFVGSEPILYQWRRGGVELEGETNQFLQRLRSSISDAGDYDVVARNNHGALTSVVAQIVVTPSAPNFLPAPTWKLAKGGQRCVFQPAFAGSPPLQLQWHRDGVPLPNQTNATLTLDFLSSSMAGAYSLAATNSMGAAVSIPTQLKVVRGFGEGSVVGWGNTRVPTHLGIVHTVEAGQFHSLVIQTNGIAIGWDNESAGQHAIHPEATNLVAVAAGDTFSLGLRDDGRVFSWGTTNFGLDQVPADLGRVVAIAAGRAHALALREDGSVRSWGSPALNVLNIPATVVNITDIVARGNASAALRADGRVFSWGSDAAAITPGIATNWVSIHIGSRNVVLLGSKGETLAFGNLRPPLAATNFISAAAGPSYAMGLRSDGSLFSWGSQGPPASRIPAGLSNVVAISAHAASTLAITRSPVIRSLPLPRTIGLGQSTVLQSSVEGLEPLSFEWLKDGKPIPGETNASLVLNSVGVEQRGTYSLRVTNPWQSITSAPTEVRVLESLGFQILRAPLNRHLLRINAIGVNNAFVQFSPNQVDWYEYPEIQLSPTPTTLEFFPLLESDTGFWRLRIP
jgi:alpha-tubulin suppressor-like RCC1 family protein